MTLRAYGIFGVHMSVVHGRSSRRGGQSDGGTVRRRGVCDARLRIFEQIFALALAIAAHGLGAIIASVGALSQIARIYVRSFVLWTTRALIRQRYVCVRLRSPHEYRIDTGACKPFPLHVSMHSIDTFNLRVSIECMHTEIWCVQAKLMYSQPVPAAHHTD